jgi:hypothetical protein
MNTIRFGDDDVPVLERSWPCAPRSHYRKTYRMKPGDRWPDDVPATDQQFEWYVELGGEVMPAGAAIARELMADGAVWAVFTELWGSVILVGPDLVCQPLTGDPAALLSRLREANDGRLGGLPDVIGERPDGTVVMREAKTPKSHDRLRANQHKMARSARRLLGDKLDLAVVSWSPPLTTERNTA